MIDQLQSLLSEMSGGGWDGLERTGQTFDAAARRAGEAEQAEVDRQAKIVAAVLSGDEGRAFLDLILKMTVLRAEGDDERGAETAEAYAIAKARRAGQNSMVFWLLARLARHAGTQKQQGGIET